MLEKPLISFDYAIKYLLRNKGDYDIIEGFISALLAIQGYKPVKINALLDGESNKETAELKRSIADLVVEDEDGNKYIVEIERALTANFMHKACFNTSRLVVDSIYGNQDYTTIKKVFHISLLYFSKKEMNKPIYHGKTIIHEIDTANPIDMRIANQGFVVYEHHNVFPEYFFISVPSFNDVINNEIDEWLYVMKHSDTREDFKSPYMKKVAERLSMLKMSTEERNTYYYYVKEAMQAQDTLTAAKIEGKEEGRIEGRIEGKEEGKIEGEQIGIEKGKRAERHTTVLKMLKLSMSIETIQAVTNFTKEEIEDISKENNNSEE